jgi:hypothetical protein
MGALKRAVYGMVGCSHNVILKFYSSYSSEPGIYLVIS